MLAALKWVTNNPSIATTIPSMTDMDQLDENLKAMAGPSPADDEKMLAAHLEQIQPLYCRLCGKCDGACAKGLPVADVLRFLTYADGYGQFALGRERFLELASEQAAVRCGDCAECTVKCPHGVQVSQPHGARTGAVRMRVAHLALVSILLAAGMARAQDSLNCQLAPGWTQSEAIRQYTADNLYDYKDGGAEGYLIYGFAGMKSLNCKSGDNTLTIDVSEMNDADAAYGLFAANRDPRLPIAKIGMGGQMQPQSASFAKGKYYVEIVVTAANPDIDHTAELQALADKMARSHRGPGDRPGGVGVVPAREPPLRPPGSRKRAGAEAAQARLRGEVQAGAGIHRAGGLAGVRRRGAEEAARAV